MKNKTLLRILALSFSLVLLVSCFVIAPSADDKDNLNYYWCSVKNDIENFNEKPESMELHLTFESPIPMRIDFISDRVNGQNVAKTVYCDKLDITLLQICSDGVPPYEYDLKREIDIDLHKEGSDFDQSINIEKRSRLSVSNNGVITSSEISYMDVHITGFGEGVDHHNWHWENTFGSYFLQMYIDQTRLTGLQYNSTYFWGESLPDLDLVEFCSMFFTVTKTSVPKTYNEGYSLGYLYGYDLGNEDGLGEGYNIGWEEGRIYGIDEGYDDGYADAKAVYDTSEAWQDMKSLIFAIFDAPFYVISYSLDFDLFGINVAGTLIALISTALIVWILKIIIVKLF